jgi:hypothetical protein
VGCKVCTMMGFCCEQFQTGAVAHNQDPG